MVNRNFLILSLILTIIAFGCQSGSALQENSSLLSLEYQRPAFEFIKIADGVYQASGTENLPVWCNAAIIINESDVIIVDTHVVPEAVVALLDELREITQKPVRYVINTHFHFDHVFGNQAYPAEVEIIGHEFARDKIASGASMSGRAFDRYIATVPNVISSFREQLNTVSNPKERAEIEQMLVYQENLLVGARTVKPTPPNMTFKQSLTLYRGEREIQLLFLGRGHTGGNIVVYLPRERILISGDLIYETLSYMGDAYFFEWVETLEQLKSLEFDWIIPGHGAPFNDRSRIDYFQSYLRDFWERVQTLYKTDVNTIEAANQIDMRNHSENYPEIQSVGVDPHSVERAYELLDSDLTR